MGEIIKKENVFIDIDVHSFEELIEVISKPLIAAGDVKEEFPDQVIKREEKFPTGLPTVSYGVAIPHTDPQWVNENRVTVATLKSPIKVHMMMEDQQEVDVSIVFLMALGQSNKHLNILQKLIKLIQDQEVLQQIKDGNQEQILDIVKNVIED